MAMKIRLSRGGSKKRPFYRIVAADSRMPRDGRYIERLGTYNPLLPKDSDERVKMNLERIQYWLGEGAQPTDRISRMLEASGVMEKKVRANLKKGEPGQKAKDRIEQKAAKLAEAEAAPAEAEAAPAEAEAAPAEAEAEAAPAEAEAAPAEAEAAPAEAEAAPAETEAAPAEQNPLRQKQHPLRQKQKQHPLRQQAAPAEAEAAPAEADKK
jgi:small subunit ribosomal protein S16